MSQNLAVHLVAQLMMGHFENGIECCGEFMDDDTAISWIEENIGDMYDNDNPVCVEFRKNILIELNACLKLPKPLVAVCFGSDGCTGDSNFQPEFNFKYDPAMTVDDLKVATYKLFAKNDGYGDGCVEDWLFEEGDNFDLSGWWIIEKEKLDIIFAHDFQGGNDSAVYAFLNGLKTQIKNAAEQIISS